MAYHYILGVSNSIYYIKFISHIISYTNSGKAKSIIYEKMANGDKYNPSFINNIIYKYNTSITVVNILSIVVMFLGVLGILAFYICQISLYN